MFSLMEKAEFVICHGGAATLDECLALRKKVIVVPRCAEYRENVDDHQSEIAEYLADMNRVLLARDLDELRGRLTEVANWNPVFAERRSTRQDVAAAIRQFVERTMAEQMKK
jgi:UDP-N-acetylglucosamine transferase subunit ALG13